MVTNLNQIKVCVFDAYGTLFDVHSAVAGSSDRLGEKAQPVSRLWRNKQLEYTWLRSLMRRHVDFWQVTGEALEYALAAHDLEDRNLYQSLMQAYMQLECYPEVQRVLQKLSRAGFKLAILSNGSPAMLDAAVRCAGIGTWLDAVLSVETIGIYKPDPAVYQLAVDRFDAAPQQITFQSSNAWDIAGAAVFGFRTLWINRQMQPAERLPGQVDGEISTLSEMPAWLGIE